MMRCRPGIPVRTKAAEVPDQRCTTRAIAAFTRVFGPAWRSRCTTSGTRSGWAAPSPRQQRLHHRARLGEIHLAGMALLERGHHLAHVLDALRAGCLDGFGDRRFGLRLRHLLRQVFSDDLDLAALAIGELLASGLVVDLDRFLALLDELVQQADDLIVAERPLAPRFRLDVRVLDGGIDEAQGRYPPLVSRFHCLLEGGVDLVAQHGY